jgi:hypothetical protein
MRRWRVLKAAVKAITWTALTTALGLIQVWLTLFVVKLVPSKPFNLQRLLHDGVLLFFIMAIVATITIDFYHGKSFRLPLWIHGVLFAFVPFVTALFVAGTYAALFLADSSLVDAGVLVASQELALVLVVVYATGAKYLMFLSQEERV